MALYTAETLPLEIAQRAVEEVFTHPVTTEREGNSLSFIFGRQEGEEQGPEETGAMEALIQWHPRPSLLYVGLSYFDDLWFHRNSGIVRLTESIEKRIKSAVEEEYGGKGRLALEEGNPTYPIYSLLIDREPLEDVEFAKEIQKALIQATFALTLAEPLFQLGLQSGGALPPLQSKLLIEGQQLWWRYANQKAPEVRWC